MGFDGKKYPILTEVTAQKTPVYAHAARRAMRRRFLAISNFEARFSVLAEMILARNVVNTNEIDKFVAHQHTDDMPPINEWLDTTMRKFLINRYDKVKHYVPQESDPAWMKGKTDLESIVLDDTLTQKVQHVVDFLKNKLTTEPTFKLGAFQAEEAFKQAQDWTNRLMKKKTEAEEEGKDYKVLLDVGDGWRWLDLTSENSLVREGKLMGHCVGGYYAGVKSGREKIFSLRDSKNEPHATIEYLPRGQKIQQIKGKQNKELKEEYVPYLAKFLQSNVIPIKKVDAYDLNRNGLIKADQGFLHVNHIPDGAVINQDLDLSELKDVKLPKNMTVKGTLTVKKYARLSPGLTVGKDLILKKSDIEWLPRGLKVGGSLNIFGCSSLRELPNDIKVKQNLNAEFSGLERLPNSLKVGGDLTLSDTEIKELPSKLQVGGELDLMNTSIMKIPEDLKVGKAIFVDDAEEMEIPKLLKKKVH